jgi:hypothetical protein
VCKGTNGGDNPLIRVVPFKLPNWTADRIATPRDDSETATHWRARGYASQFFENAAAFSAAANAARMTVQSGLAA